MMGKVEFALYIMGKACIDDPSNTDNRNNYAAMLSMCGAPQLAIPLLNSLNQRFPKNSTVLNNIGQAWFGLGDIDKANAYLTVLPDCFPVIHRPIVPKVPLKKAKAILLLRLPP